MQRMVAGRCRAPALRPAPLAQPRCRHRPSIRCEKKEYYSAKDMPPVPANVARIVLPDLKHTVVDESTRTLRKASLAIFFDIASDGQYSRKLNARSALTALCMYDAEDVLQAEAHPGQYPNIDLLKQVTKGIGESEIVVEQAQ